MGMKSILELSKEHNTLPISEIEGIFEGENINYKILMEKPVVMVESDEIEPIIDRSAFLKRIGIVLFFVKDIINDVTGKMAEGVTFAIRYFDFVNKNINRMEIEKNIGKNIEGKVNLKNPDVEIGIYHINDLYYFTELLPIPEKRFLERHPNKRPYKTNLAMKPKLARAMVNLARVKRGGRIADPFCGGGSILIEAGLMGIESVGIDIESKMVNGCIANTSYYNIKTEIYRGDFSLIKDLGKFDAIVTDPPYGRSSFKTEPIDHLYQRALKTFRDVIKENGHVSIIFPSEKYVEIAKEYFHVLEIHKLYVHKSLNRYITLLSLEDY